MTPVFEVTHPEGGFSGLTAEMLKLHTRSVSPGFEPAVKSSIYTEEQSTPSKLLMSSQHADGAPPRPGNLWTQHFTDFLNQPAAAAVTSLLSVLQINVSLSTQTHV